MMAKTKKGKGGLVAAHKPDAADLKYIGAAFDRAIESLLEIKVNAENPRQVASQIDKLTKLKANTRLLCRQGWFLAFNVHK